MAIIFEWKDAAMEEGVKQEAMRRTGRILAQGKDIQIIRYDKEPGGVTPEHSHPEELIGILIKGKQEAILNGERVSIAAGMGYYIPANENHGPFTNVGDETCVTLDIVTPPRVMKADKPEK